MLAVHCAHLIREACEDLCLAFCSRRCETNDLGEAGDVWDHPFLFVEMMYLQALPVRVGAYSSLCFFSFVLHTGQDAFRRL